MPTWKPLNYDNFLFSFNVFPPVWRIETANYLLFEVTRDKIEFWFAFHSKIMWNNIFSASSCNWIILIGKSSKHCLSLPSGHFLVSPRSGGESLLRDKTEQAWHQRSIFLLTVIQTPMAIDHNIRVWVYFR